MKLTQTDLKRIEQDAQRRIKHSGASPFARQLNAAGLTVTVAMAEFIQAFALPIILIIFAALEFERVRAGALALGQTDDKALLLAAAIVTANVIHPIYTLRNRGDEIVILRHTIKSRLSQLRHFVAGDAQQSIITHDTNTLLGITAKIITWTTILLAVMDVLAPIIETGIQQDKQYLDLIVGLGVSVGGVFFLQSAAHEIGLIANKHKTVTYEDAYERAKQTRIDDKRQERRDRMMLKAQAGLQVEAKTEGELFSHNGHQATNESASSV